MTRPSRHIRNVRTRRGRKRVLVNPYIRKRIQRRRNYGMVFSTDFNVKSGQTIKNMSPDEFLSKTTPMYDPDKFYDYEKDEPRPLSELTEKIKDPKILVDIPYVGSEPSDHEGRHRAVAAKRAGMLTIPVAVPVPRERREELANEFIKKKFPETSGLEGWQIKQRDRDSESWRQRITEKDFPESLMDLENQRLLKNVKKDLGLNEIK